MRFLAVAPLIFDQFVIARRSLQRRPAIIVCRWVRDLRLNLGDWPYPLTWFVHCGISQISANVVRDEFHGRIASSCFSAPFKRWRKPLMYSSSSSCCCWCICSNVRKPSTRRFLSFTRSARSNSRAPIRYRVFVAAGFSLLFAVLIVVGFFSCLLVG